MKQIVTFILVFCTVATGYGAIEKIHIRHIPDSAYAGREDIDSLMLGREVESIGRFAFADCPNLRVVRFEQGSSLGMVSDYAFAWCQALMDIFLPTCCRTLGEGVFRDCSSMENLCFPDSLLYIPRDAMRGCGKLQSVKLPQKLMSIGAHAFAYCSSLNNVVFPNKLTHIGSNAFSMCLSLEEVSLPASVIEIESYAFSGCVSLHKAVLPENEKMLGEMIFSGCEMLKSITEPSWNVPPFDCGSPLFDSDDEAARNRCILYVPSTKIDKYRNSLGWDFFLTIRGI